MFVSRETLLRDDAVRELVSAASALRLPDPNGIAAALLHTGLALLKIAELDAKERGRAIATQVLRQLVEEKSE